MTNRVKQLSFHAKNNFYIIIEQYRYTMYLNPAIDWQLWIEQPILPYKLHQ